MPAPIILQDTSGLGQGISGAAGALSQALGMRLQEQRMKQQQQKEQAKYGTVLQETLGSLPRDASPMQIISAYNKAVSQLPPEVAKAAFSAYDPLLKQTLKQESELKILRDLGLLPGVQSQTGRTQTQLGEQPEIQETQVQPAINPINNWTEDQLVLAQASGVPTVQKLADAELKKRNLDLKRDLEEKKYQSKFANKIVESNNALRKKIQDKKFASVMARDAIESGEVGRISWANIAKRTGIHELQTAKGAQLAQAVKVNLVGNLSDVSARAQNMWLEQVMSTAFPMAGQSEAANKSILEIFDAEVSMNEEYLKEFDRLKEEDEEKYGRVKWDDIEARAHKAVQSKDEEILRRTSYKTRLIYENELGIPKLVEMSKKKPPKGTPLTLQMAKILSNNFNGDFKKAVEHAKKLGYYILKRSEFESWQ